MDKSEVRFKFKKQSTSTQIPSAVEMGQIYVNTGSSFMFLKSEFNDGLMLPAIIYSTDPTDELCENDKANSNIGSYLETTDKRYIVFNKYGTNSGRFVPMNISSFIFVKSSPASFVNGKLVTKIDDDYASVAKDALEYSSIYVMAIMGYDSDEYNANHEYGSYSIVKIDSIDDDNYATIAKDDSGDYMLLGGYMIMSEAPTEENESLYETGFAWHLSNDYYYKDSDGNVNSDNIHMTAVIIGEANDHKVIEIYSPYESIITKTTYKHLSDNSLLFSCVGNDFTTDAVINCTGSSSATDITKDAISWRPPVGFMHSCTSDGIDIFKKVPSQGHLVINDESTIIANRLNNFWFTGWRFFDKTLTLDITSATDSTPLDSDIVSMLQGMNIVSNMNVEMNAFLASKTKDSDTIQTNVPISLIHGCICSNISSITNLKFGSSSQCRDIINNVPISIRNIAVCNAGDVLGGEDFVSDAADIVFLLIDYQYITKSMQSTATLRKYIRCETTSSEDPSGYTYKGTITVGEGENAKDLTIYLS